MLATYLVFAHNQISSILPTVFYPPNVLKLCGQPFAQIEKAFGASSAPQIEFPTSRRFKVKGFRKFEALLEINAFGNHFPSPEEFGSVVPNWFSFELSKNKSTKEDILAALGIPTKGIQWVRQNEDETFAKGVAGLPEGWIVMCDVSDPAVTELHIGNISARRMTRLEHLDWRKFRAIGAMVNGGSSYHANKFLSGGRSFLYGAGTTAPMDWTISLDKQGDQFFSLVGPQDGESNDKTAVVYEVYTDDNLLVRSQVVRKGSRPQILSGSLKGASFLRLKVLSIGGNKEDGAQWLDAQIKMLPGSKSRPDLVVKP